MRGPGNEVVVDIALAYIEPPIISDVVKPPIIRFNL